MKWEYRKRKETYTLYVEFFLDVYPVEITLVNYSYNVTISSFFMKNKFNINFSIKNSSEFQNFHLVGIDLSLVNNECDVRVGPRLGEVNRVLCVMGHVSGEETALVKNVQTIHKINQFLN